MRFSVLMLVALWAFRPASWPLVILLAIVCIIFAMRSRSARRAKQRWARLQGWAKQKGGYSVDADAYPGRLVPGPPKALSRG